MSEANWLSDSNEPAVADPRRRLVRGSSLNIAGAICQQGAIVLTTWVIARYLGSSALGQYALAYALLSVLGLLALCGFRAALTRFITTQLADDDPGAVRGTVRMCLLISVLGSLVLGALLVVLAPQIASLFEQSGLVGAIRVVACALPGATIRDSALAATQGWRSQRAFALIGWVYEPLIRLAVTAAAIGLGFGLAGAYFALLFGTWTAAAAACRALHQRMARLGSGSRRFETRRVLSFAMVSWAASLATTGLLWADTLMLGYFTSLGDVGLYNVATRLATLGVFLVMPINAAFAPEFAHDFHRLMREHAAETYTSATNWIVRLSLPVFVVILVFPADLLHLFGADYRDAANVTVILAIGLLVTAMTGPCGTALLMAGRVSLNMVNNVGVLVLNVGLNLWWIPSHGIAGAALAWSVSLIAVNLARFVQLYWLTGIAPYGEVTAKSFFAAAVAAAAAVLVRVALGPTVLQAVIGSTAALAVYVVVVVALGLADDERRAVQMVTPDWLRVSRRKHAASRW